MASTVATTTTSAATTTSNSVATPAKKEPEQNNERSAVVLALFGPSVGPCVGDFSTTYNRVNGRLYASTKAILFYSNLFGFERRLCLQLSDVEVIESYRSTSIRVSLVDCEEYIFRRFANRDSVLNLLQQLLQQHDYPSEALDQPGSPTIISRNLIAASDVTEGSERDDEVESLRPHLNSEIIPRSSDVVSPPEDPSPRSARDDDAQPSRPRGRARSVPPPKRKRKSLAALKKAKSKPAIRRSQSTIISSSGDALDISQASTEFSVDNNMESTELTSSEHSDADVQHAWDEAKVPFEEISLETIRLSCTLDRFVKLFFADDATFPIMKYQKEQVGDKNMKVSPWKRIHPAGQPPVLVRTLNFIHPLKNAVGPSEAKTRRTQTFRRFGELGMTLENTTVIEGVPAADCFRVEDRWIIEKASDSTLTMLVSFRMTFVKRTMFKPVIQKNTRSETKNWIRGFSTFVKAVLSGSDIPAVPNSKQIEQPRIISPLSAAPPTMIPPVATAEQSTLDLVFKLGTLVFLFVLVLQVFMLQRALFSMQSHMMEMQLENSQLIAAVLELQRATISNNNPLNQQPSG